MTILNDFFKFFYHLNCFSGEKIHQVLCSILLEVAYSYSSFFFFILLSSFSTFIYVTSSFYLFQTLSSFPMPGQNIAFSQILFYVDY